MSRARATGLLAFWMAFWPFLPVFAVSLTPQSVLQRTDSPVNCRPVLTKIGAASAHNRAML